MSPALNELCAGVFTVLGIAGVLMMLVGTLAGLREAGRRQ